MRSETKKLVNGLHRFSVYRTSPDAASEHLAEEYQKEYDKIATEKDRLKVITAYLSENKDSAKIVFKDIISGELGTVEWTTTVVKGTEFHLPQYLYHVTDKSNADRILADGIHIGYGKNAILAADKHNPGVYLCEYDSIAHWAVLLGKGIVIQVDTTGFNDSNIEKYSYGNYGEWFTELPVEASKCQLKPMLILASSVMSDLVCGYIMGMSEFIVELTRIGTHPNQHSTNTNLMHDIKSSIDIFNSRLDSSALAPAYIKNKLAEVGEDGDYTMCDMYCVNERYGKDHLWEQLPKYDFSHPTLAPMRDTYIMAYEFVRDNCSWARELETGGYTG